MKIFRLALATTAAAFLMTASLAGACDGHKAKAQATSGEAQAVSGTEKVGCAKSASAKAGCAKSASGKAGCAKSASAKAGCCAKGAAVMASIGDTTDMTACTFKPGAVAFKGTVLCNHCNLKKSETCATMFRTDSGCLFALAGEKSGDLREAAVGGTKLVRIKGTVSEDGELVVSSFRVVKTLDSGASAL